MPSEQNLRRLDEKVKRASTILAVTILGIIAFKSLALFWVILGLTAACIYILQPEIADEWIEQNQCMLTFSALGFFWGGGGFLSILGLAMGTWLGSVFQKILNQAEQRTRPVRNAYEIATHPRQALGNTFGWLRNILGNGFRGGLSQGERVIINPTRNAYHRATQSTQAVIQKVKNWLNREENEDALSERSSDSDDDYVSALDDFMTDDDSDNEAPFQEAPPAYLVARNRQERREEEHTHATAGPYARRALHH